MAWRASRRRLGRPVKAGTTAGTLSTVDLAPSDRHTFTLVDAGPPPAGRATHVLPTSGLAKGAGGLGLESFLKPVLLVRAESLERAREIALPLARIEELPRHAAARAAR